MWYYFELRFTLFRTELKCFLRSFAALQWLIENTGRLMLSSIFAEVKFNITIKNPKTTKANMFFILYYKYNIGLWDLLIIALCYHLCFTQYPSFVGTGVVRKTIIWILKICVIYAIKIISNIISKSTYKGHNWHFSGYMPRLLSVYMGFFFIELTLVLLPDVFWVCQTRRTKSWPAGQIVSFGWLRNASCCKNKYALKGASHVRSMGTISQHTTGGTIDPAWFKFI